MLQRNITVVAILLQGGKETVSVAATVFRSTSVHSGRAAYPVRSKATYHIPMWAGSGIINPVALEMNIAYAPTKQTIAVGIRLAAAEMEVAYIKVGGKARGGKCVQ